ncbi:MAG: 3-deoxy-7-phosphoheptulonate synthase [Candidatus Eutrophobiaceae bacterium]
MDTPSHKYPVDDQRISSIKAIPSPLEICEEFPLAETCARQVYETRRQIHEILIEQDSRLLLIVGPCSIHDVDAAREYAGRLLELKSRYERDLLILMRVYFEKPRTTVGWKGLINDPMLDDSFMINKGLRLARQLLLDLNDMGMPAGTEYLDLITPQYVADLISWGAIGARTSESQVHRELASGLSCPVGFKNGTNGSAKVAIDAIGAASQPHHFLSLRKEGHSAVFTTTGNPDCHIILRGGSKPNYDRESVEEVVAALSKAGLPERIMIDLSHANSAKQHDRQMEVGAAVGSYLHDGDNRIFGVMIESHLVAGRQDVTPGRELTYGQSITDACLGWEDTVKLIAQLAEASRARFNKN